MAIRQDTKIKGYLRTYENEFLNTKYIMSIKEKYTDDTFTTIKGTEITMADGTIHLIQMRAEPLIKELNRAIRGD